MAAGEKLWRMPMEESYWEQMKSPIADMKNTGGRMGGAITAAPFLREYVDTEKVCFELTLLLPASSWNKSKKLGAPPHIWLIGALLTLVGPANTAALFLREYVGTEWCLVTHSDWRLSPEAWGKSHMSRVGRELNAA